MQTAVTSDTSLQGLDLKDPSVFSALYETHVNRVYRHAYYFLRSQAEAEDIAAQTFLKAWEHIDKYEDRGKPISSWLLTVAHNLIMTRLRKAQRQNTLDGDYLAGSFGQPEEEFLQGCREQDLADAVLKLKPLECQVVLLRFIEGLDYATVAEMVGKSVNAVRIIQYRALRNLRSLTRD